MIDFLSTKDLTPLFEGEPLRFHHILGQSLILRFKRTVEHGGWTFIWDYDLAARLLAPQR